MKRRMLLFVSVYLLIGPTWLAMGQEMTDLCTKQKQEMRITEGEPDEIDDSGTDNYKKVSVWKYYEKHYQYEFRYIYASADFFTSCTVNKNVVSYTTEKGKDILISALKKKYPKWTDKSFGFKNIPFGMSRDDCVTMLKINGMTFNVSTYGNEDISVEFSLGGSPVSTTLEFDHNGTFYELSFRNERHSALEFDRTVKEDATYLTEVLKKKFGKPTKCYPVQFLSVSHGYVTYQCKWNQNTIEAYSGIGSFESTYFAIASVKDKKLADAFETHQTKEKKQNMNTGASSF